MADWEPTAEQKEAAARALAVDHSAPYDNSPKYWQDRALIALRAAHAAGGGEEPTELERRLRASLERYGEHERGCPAASLAEAVGRCRCGFHAALAAVPGGGEEARLREAVEEYADHNSWRCGHPDRYPWEPDCPCGLTAVLRELGIEMVAENPPPDWRCECGDHNRWHEATCYRCGAGRTGDDEEEG